MAVLKKWWGGAGKINVSVAGDEMAKFPLS